MPTPVKAKAMSFSDVFEKARQKAIENQKKFNESGGMCINCGKNPGNQKSLICKACEKEINDLVKKLHGPGFVAVIPKFK